MRRRRGVFAGGEPFIWLTGGALAIALLMVAGLVGVILANALGFFWPREVLRLTLRDGTVLAGQVVDRERVHGVPDRWRIKVKVGNRDLGPADFRWVDEDAIARRERPPDLTVVERTEWGVLIGTVTEVRHPGPAGTALRVLTADGRSKDVPLPQVVRVHRPNAMSVAAKIRHYAAGVWEFVAAGPRESNTEGGVFPALFGTVMMVVLMSIVVAPLGVLAAFYLREYAKQGPLVSAVRIAVNNLAGVPSIVFGVFGVGFFIYGIGGAVDRWFFSDALPTPTFGTGGILWASLTLALLTIPVVVVATEEGLAAVPRGAREASLALGATKLETTLRVVLPAVMPSILTGLILAMARAAGEVAPLMLTGVVKLAPSLPLDTVPPFFHLERKFMHLGFHIYDVGFQSPNVDAARPMVFATTLLLLAMVVLLNLTAIRLRSHLRWKYRTSAV